MCGLLSDDDGDDLDGDPAEGLDGGDEPEADGGAAEGEPVDEPSEPDEPQAGEADGEGEENDLDVESTLKDLAARMSRLSSHIEGIEDDREQMEDKLDEVENQLGQLGNLAEVVSSQYNPFITEDAPGNPEWDQRDADARGGDPMRRAPEGSPDPPNREEMVLDEAALQATPAGDAGDETGEEAGAGEGLGDAFADDPPPALDDSDQDLLTDDPAGGAGEEAGPGELRDGPPDPASLDLSEAPDPTAEGEDAFDRNVLLLEWVEHMMEQVGRDGLLDLLEYYEALGWLDEPLKNRALRVATGIDVDAEASHDGDRAWRGDTDLHERALVVLERLGGRREHPESRLEELQLDLDRIFDR